MRIEDLFYHIPALEKIHWNPHRQITQITSDSRAVANGHLFVACSGTRMDGHDFIGQAVMAGASVVVCERLPDFNLPQHIVFVKVADARSCLTKLLNRFYHCPDKKVKLIGVTGTNGKTTTAQLLYRMLRQKAKAAYIGTIEYELPSVKIQALNTTPGPEILIPLLAQMHNESVEYCVMEISSHALEQGRISGLQFEMAVFTQLTQDHLDYHITMERYYQAKRSFFMEVPGPAKMLINRDCLYGRRLLDENLQAKSYSLHHSADFEADHVQTEMTGSSFHLHYPGGDIQFRIPLIFQHNVYNSLAVLGALSLLGYDPAEFREDMENMEGIAGRLEKVTQNEEFQVFVDYAHTPDAFENVLSQAIKLKKNRILTLFGCGGDRDREKRPLMAKVAVHYSDVTVFTSDNPRSEDPEAILKDMKKGLRKMDLTHKEVVEVLDRKEAIDKIISLARPGDLVFLLGKGHEDYQILGDTKIPFDDRVIARECLKRKTRVLAG